MTRPKGGTHSGDYDKDDIDMTSYIEQAQNGDTNMDKGKNTEPVVTVAGIVAAVTAIIALVTAFGLDLTSDQSEAILGITAVVAPLIVIYARQWVVPVSKLDRTPPQPNLPEKG